MSTIAPSRPSPKGATAGLSSSADRMTRPDTEETARAAGYPISRWYIRPLAGRFADALVSTAVHPNHLTLCGLVCATAAAAWLIALPTLAPIAGLLFLTAWFFDRADGQLARRQGTASAWGAWLDANIDELVDFGIHTAMALAAFRLTGTPIAWYLLLGFFAGKYLFMHGLTTEEAFGHHAEKTQKSGDSGATAGLSSSAKRDVRQDTAGQASSGTHFRQTARGCLRRLYHLPGNADVRIHLAVLALVSGWILVELAILAVYYNLRWIVRYGLVARRLGGTS